MFAPNVTDDAMTTYQRDRLRYLLATKQVPWNSNHLVQKLGNGGISRDEAAVLIDRMANAPSLPTPADRAAAALRDHLWGQMPGWQYEPETVVADRWDEVLDPHFHIQREVTGRHWAGKPLRIDRVLWPRFSWGNGRRTPIGFEIKTARGTKHDTRQANDYANTTWRLDPPNSPSCEWDMHAPENGLLLIGLHRDDPEQSRALEPHGAFAFVVRPGGTRSWRPDRPRAGDPFIGLYFNGHLMWATEPGVASVNNWAPTRKIGAQ